MFASIVGSIAKQKKNSEKIFRLFFFIEKNSNIKIEI